MPFSFTSSRFSYALGVFIGLSVAGVSLCLLILFIAPASFPQGAIVNIPKGTTVRSAALLLSEGGAISSSEAFVLSARLLGGGVQEGAYLLDRREGVFRLAERLARGDYRLSSVKITFPEGITIKDMARICARAVVGCSESEFISAARGQEGYLFPETYIFLPGTSAERVVKAMRAEFDKRTADLLPRAQSFGKPFSDIVTMASLLEGEASSTRHRQEVAGILWKRLAIRMPLQVDAAFMYVNGKNTFDLTRDDLAIDSPYNTYLYRGLPPTPINNPGLDALTAALTPVESPYLYYLTGSDGKFYFARTYEEHLRNKARYLK